ncbi:MAG: hypothetical protein OEW77_11795 [Gemmatimonadota bacterium]|nr:hypothetical protein [Gemmatimonadota bacterium]
MFTQILWTQLKWTRIPLAVLAVVTFAAPALAWRLGAAGYQGAASEPMAIMVGFSAIGTVLMVTACLAGFVLVAHVWNLDAAAKHVYALSLPLPWSRFVAMRFGAGALSLLIPTLALWLGSLFALMMVQVPPTLHTYAGTLALRFLLGALLAYALSFLLQYVAGRRASAVLLVLLLSGVVVTFVLSVLGYTRLLDTIGHAIVEWPGPLAVFARDWKLVDV